MKLFGFEIKREVTGLPVTPKPQIGGANWLENIIRVSSEGEAMSIGVVQRCVNLISDGIATMPLRLKMRDKMGGVFRDVIDDPEHWYYLLNVRPNKWQNGFVFKKNIVAQMLLRGNAYVMALGDNGRVVALNSGAVSQLVLLGFGSVSYNQYANSYSVADPVSNITGVFTGDYVLHFKNPSSDGGFLGDSTIDKAKLVLSVIATGNRMQLRNFATGGRGKYILGYEEGNTGGWGGYQKDEMQGAAKDVEERLSKQDVVTLPRAGLDLKPLSFSVDQLQFSDTYKQAIEDVARFFGVPLYKITGSSSNYKTVDAAQVDFYTECLQPYCSQMQTELLSKTTTMTDWWKYKFDFDETPLFTLDMDTKAKWLKSQQELGLKTVNDMRVEMDLQPVKGGDEVLMSANLKTLAMLKKEGQQPGAAAEPPLAGKGGNSAKNGADENTK